MRLIIIVLCLSACAPKPVILSSKHPDNEYCESHFDIKDDDAQVGCLIDLEDVRTQEYVSAVHNMEVK